MKHVAIYLCVLALVFLLSYEYDDVNKCSGCSEYEEIAGYCPCCDAALCAWCLPDVEDEVNDYTESGYQDGYEYGYYSGYYYAAEVIFDRMTTEEYQRWTEENREIEKYFDDGKGR